MVKRGALPRIASICRRVLLATVCLLVLLQFATGGAFGDVATSSLDDGPTSQLDDTTTSTLADGTVSSPESASLEESPPSGSNASESPSDDDGQGTSGP
jgi:hypothetical protein